MQQLFFYFWIKILKLCVENAIIINIDRLKLVSDYYIFKIGITKKKLVKISD